MFRLHGKYGDKTIDAHRADIYDRIVCFNRLDGTVALAMPIENIYYYSWEQD